MFKFKFKFKLLTPNKQNVDKNIISAVTCSCTTSLGQSYVATWEGEFNWNQLEHLKNANLLKGMGVPWGDMKGVEDSDAEPKVAAREMSLPLPLKQESWQSGGFSSCL